MLTLAKIKGGSHLYGLNTPESDEDIYEIVALSPAERAFEACILLTGDQTSPGEVDQHHIDITELLSGRLDTMWALELLFADPEEEAAPEWNRLRDIRKMLCTPTMCSQTYFRLHNTISNYAVRIQIDAEAEVEWVVKEGFSSKPVHARNLAHAYRMGVQLLNYITTRDLFGTEFKMNQEAYHRLKNNVVAVEDLKICLETLYGINRLRKDGVGITSEYYDSVEFMRLAWECINSTTQAAHTHEIKVEEVFSKFQTS